MRESLPNFWDPTFALTVLKFGYLDLSYLNYKTPIDCDEERKKYVLVLGLSIGELK